MLRVQAHSRAHTTEAADLNRTNVSTAETYSRVSFWDPVGPAGGTFLGSDDLAMQAPSRWVTTSRSRRGRWRSPWRRSRR